MPTTTPPSQQTHYQVLGIPESADAVAIKEAYRSLVLRHHPDKNNPHKNGNDDNALILLAQIQQAYHVLREERQAYDATLRLQRQKSQSRFESALVLEVADCIIETDEDGTKMLVYPCRCGAFLDTSPLNEQDSNDMSDEEEGLLDCPGCSLVYDTRKLHDQAIHS